MTEVRAPEAQHRPYGVMKLRRRDASRSSDLLTDADLHQLGQLLSSTQDEPPVHSKMEVFEVDYSAGLRPAFSVDDLARRLRHLLDSTDNVILDWRIGAYESTDPDLNLSLATAWTRIAAHVDKSQRVLLLVDSLDEGLHSAIAPLVENGTVRVVASDGTIIPEDGHLWDLPKDVAALASPDASDYRRVVDERLLRRRGLFLSSDDEFGQYIHYRYSADRCEHYLALLVQSILASLRRPTMVVFDASSSPWLEVPVAGAVNDLQSTGVHLFSASDVPDLDEVEAGRPDLEVDDGPLDARFVRLAEDAESVLLIVGLTKSGKTIARHCKRLREFVDREIAVLSVAFDSDGRQVVEPDFDGTSCALLPLSGDTSQRVHYLVEAPQEVLDREAWQARAVVDSLGVASVEDAQVDLPSMVGMLSLMTEYGFEPESVLPRERPPVARMPRLSRLDRWDSHWLAESLVLAAESLTSSLRAEMLIVIPEEANGSTVLAEAMRSRLDVRALGLSRDVIRGDDELSADQIQLLKDYSGRPIVVCDESTVDYGTLESINKLVMRTVQRDADGFVAVFDLGDRTNPRRPAGNRFKSLLHWKAERT